MSNKVGFKKFWTIMIVTLLREERTALIWASLKGHKKVVTLLLDGGADIHARDRYQIGTPKVWNHHGCNIVELWKDTFHISNRRK